MFLKVESCNVYIMFPYPGTPIQIESKVPIRDKNGRLHKVSEAKNLGISKMSPETLEGLEKTFNIYLNLPKSLWPIIELSEKKENWSKILSPLKNFSVQYISDQVEDYDLRDDYHEINSRKIPKQLYEIFLSAIGDGKEIILKAINKFLEETTLDNRQVDNPSFSAAIQW